MNDKSMIDSAEKGWW